MPGEQAASVWKRARLMAKGCRPWWRGGHRWKFIGWLEDYVYEEGPFGKFTKRMIKRKCIYCGREILVHPDYGY